MRPKNHDLQQRGNVWQLRIRIPKDVLGFYAANRNPYVVETLKTRELSEARRLRDERLVELRRLWADMRKRTRRLELKDQTQQSDDASDYLLSLRDDPEQASIYISILGDLIDRKARPIALSESLDDLNDARDELIRTDPEVREHWREIQIAQGSLTPLKPLCMEWLDTKGGRVDKTRMDYLKAIEVLVERFPNKEDITHRKARSFLAELLKGRAKATVQKYTIAYRGVWRYQGWLQEAEMWSIRDMDSSVPVVKVLSYTNEQFIELMNEARRKGRRKLWLAMKIAAYSGASRSGVAGLELRKGDGREVSLYLPETKKEWRTRIVPCHPSILTEVEEWVTKPLAMRTITDQFAELKTSLGHGREHVYHSFRHSVANRLENARINTREIKRLMGHATGIITFDTYNAEGLDYSVLAEVVNAIVWPEVHWD